jgi:hypothetical protein
MQALPDLFWSGNPIETLRHDIFFCIAVLIAALTCQDVLCFLPYNTPTHVRFRYARAGKIRDLPTVFQAW